MIKAINKRHSVRKYVPDKQIPEEEMFEILANAKTAPSAGSLKSYYSYLVSRKDKFDAVAKSTYQYAWIKDASLIIVVCADVNKAVERYGYKGKYLYCIQDATIFCSYLDLLFVEKGYGTCWVGGFSVKKVRKILKIPEYLNPITYLIVGYEMR